MIKEFQQQRVYDAESLFTYNAAQAGDENLRRLNVGEGLSQEIVNEVVNDLVRLGFQFQTQVHVTHDPRKRGGGLAYRYSGRILVPRYTSRHVLIHEVCHHTVAVPYPGHGVEFAKAEVAYHDLHGQGELIRTAFQAKGVAWAHGQRAKAVRAKLVWLFRDNGPRRAQVWTRENSSFGNARFFGTGQRTGDGILFTDPHRPYSVRKGTPEQIAAGAVPDSSGPLLVRYEEVAYVAPY